MGAFHLVCSLGLLRSTVEGVPHVPREWQGELFIGGCCISVPGAPALSSGQQDRSRPVSLGME